MHNSRKEKIRSESGEKAQGPGEGERCSKERALACENSGNLRGNQCGGSSAQGQGVNGDRKKLYQKHCLKGRVSMNWGKVLSQHFTEKALLWATVVFLSLSFVPGITDSRGSPISSHC